MKRTAAIDFVAANNVIPLRDTSEQKSASGFYYTYHRGIMSTIYPKYTTEDMAQALDVSPYWVRQVSRQIQVGTLQANRVLFSQTEAETLLEEFERRRQARADRARALGISQRKRETLD